MNKEKKSAPSSVQDVLYLPGSCVLGTWGRVYVSGLPRSHLPSERTVYMLASIVGHWGAAVRQGRLKRALFPPPSSCSFIILPSHYSFFVPTLLLQLLSPDSGAVPRSSAEFQELNHNDVSGRFITAPGRTQCESKMFAGTEIYLPLICYPPDSVTVLNRTITLYFLYFTVWLPYNVLPLNCAVISWYFTFFSWNLLYNRLLSCDETGKRLWDGFRKL
jgi:hypothetical protein